MPKVVLITGATRGLGKAIAEKCVEAGFTTIIGARTVSDGKALVDALDTGDATVDGVQLDVTNVDSIAAAAVYIQGTYHKLDVLINNAGVLDFAENDAVNLSVFTSTYAVNVFGVVAMIEHMTPLLSRSQQGRIINVSSEVGSFSVMDDPRSPYYNLHLPAYITSKTAVNAVAVLASKILSKQNIVVNALSPGFIDTDMNGHTGTRSAEEPAQEIVRMCQVTKSNTAKFYLNEAIQSG